ncbi:MAG: hypothetical protein KDD25_03455 [Bdellovibrionales bacterium]|nr:hypothetical protein [Bdellovibrionales bacterium]
MRKSSLIKLLASVILLLIMILSFQNCGRGAIPLPIDSNGNLSPENGIVGTGNSSGLGGSDTGNPDGGFLRELKIPELCGSLYTCTRIEDANECASELYGSLEFVNSNYQGTFSSWRQANDLFASGAVKFFYPNVLGCQSKLSSLFSNCSVPVGWDSNAKLTDSEIAVLYIQSIPECGAQIVESNLQ